MKLHEWPCRFEISMNFVVQAKMVVLVIGIFVVSDNFFYAMSGLSNMQSRRFCWTWNNYPEDMDLMALGERIMGNPAVRYLVYQPERGAERGTLHLQGFILFNTNWRGSRVQNLIAGEVRIHLEIARGTSEECARYCKKEEGRVGDRFYEFGELVNEQGKRNDLKEAAALIMEHKNISCLMEAHPTILMKYPAGCRLLADVAHGEPIRRERVEVNVFFGLAGCGKTFYVEGICPQDKTFHLSDLTGKWFNGLKPTDSHLVIHDYRGQMDFEFLKLLCDPQPMRVPTKGGFVNFNITTIWITTNYRWPAWYPKQMEEEMGVRALRRRITNYYVLTRDSEETHLPPNWQGNPDQSYLNPEY